MRRLRISLRPRRRLRWTVLVTAVFGSIAVVTPVLAAVQYVAYRNDDGPHGCVARTYELFTRTTDIDACIRDRSTARIEKLGVVDGLATVDADASRDPVLLSRCHVPLHLAGQRAQSAGVPPSVIADAASANGITGACTKGFVHGYMQGLSAMKDAPPGEFAVVALALCSGLDGDNRGVCIHGVGHGISRSADNRLGEVADTCAELALPSAEEYHCVRGGVMEVQMANESLRKRMSADSTIGPSRGRIDCDLLQRSQRSACVDQVRSFAMLGTAFKAGLA